MKKLSASENMLGLLAGLIVVVIWSGWIVISKWGVSHALTVWDITGLRFLTAASIVLCFAAYKSFALKSLFTAPIIFCSLCCGCFYVCASLIGLSLSDTANTGVIINGSMPIMCAIILFAWKRSRLNIGQYIGVSLILFANFLLLSSAGGASFTAGLWLLLAAFAIAFYSVSMKIWQINLEQIMVGVPVINALFYTPIWLFLPSNMAAAPVSEMIAQSVYQGIVVSIVALFCMSYSINKLGAVSASTIMALVPITSVLLAMAFLEQTMNMQMGLAIFICSLGIASYSGLQHVIDYFK